MHYTKRPLTYSEQIDLLRARGLHVADAARAKRWLNRTSYYRLSAYFIPFKIPSTDTFGPAASFDSVIELYNFDARIRLLVMQAIEKIEVAVRATIVYEMTHSLGPFAYTDPVNFAPTFDHVKLMETITHEKERSNETFVTHYQATYTLEPHLPLWMVTELVSFGTLSTMYRGFSRGLQRAISDAYEVPEGAFKTWLHTLSYTRNSCAHHNRLWNRKFAIKPKLPPGWPYMIPTNDRLYAILVVVQHMLRIIAPRCRWKDRIMALILAHPSVNRYHMGFPANWLSLEPWSSSAI
jgi:abortive infection bacteriophage resistance protein